MGYYDDSGNYVNDWWVGLTPEQIGQGVAARTGVAYNAATPDLSGFVPQWYSAYGPGATLQQKVTGEPAGASLIIPMLQQTFTDAQGRQNQAAIYQQLLHIDPNLADYYRNTQQYQ